MIPALDYKNAAAIAPSDTANLGANAKAIYVGVAGDITVTMLETGASILFKAAPVGILHIQVQKVWATGTAATNMVALW